ncbi:FGGY-family carbohydrate kinase [Actinomycetota bacterium]
MYFIGLDIGTQGARVIIASTSGTIAASASSRIKGELNLSKKEHYFEQDPVTWWEAAKTALQDAISIFKNKGLYTESIKAIAVDGTSGTVVPFGTDGKVTRNAMMYKDSRSETQAIKVNEYAKDITAKLGYRFKASFALPKILWIKENEPEIYKATKYFLHQTDYIVGRLTGIFNVSDHLNAFKTGFDLLEYEWPGFIESDLGISLEKLPEVIRPGEPISRINNSVVKDLGLAKDTQVIAGMTDSNASIFSSGASVPGDLNSTIGTTFVIKGITTNLVKDDEGTVYCHLHPEGHWLAGGASSTGGECLEYKFKGRDYMKMDQAASSLGPTGLLIYPLVGTGERFPFIAKEARGFTIGENSSENQLYRGYLEGVAYLERLSFEIMEGLEVDIGDKIYITGGGAKSDIWSQIRADILGKTLIRPKVEDTAMGAAIIASSKIHFKDITEASKNMVTIESKFYPRQASNRIYSGFYNSYKDELTKKGYIK